jgi:DNA primase
MAGLIPPEIVEQVRQACDIVDVIGGYVPLKKAGAKYKALSPFNKEKTPSFFVDPTRQMFKCFSSGHGGDVFKFLMLMENMTFPEAIRRLAQRAGVPIPETGPQDPQARSRREELLALYAGVAAWWQKLLHSDPAAEPARAYLKSRDFPSSLAEEFSLGYAPEGWDTTLSWARQAGYSPEALEWGKLVAQSESGRKFDFFRGRLMIPIHDESGQVVAFSGRLLDPETKAQKYVNSPETPIFVKSKVLFGLNRTKRPIIEADQAILCEGQIDLMRCWQKGVRNVVAPQGTAFTELQARTLKRLAKETVICFDADRAGQNAAERSVDVLLKEGVQVRIARMPEGEDPDSLLRKQPVEVFENLIREAKDYTRHLLDAACAGEGDVSSPRARGAVAQKMAQVIAKIPNAVQKESFLLEVARRLQVGRSVVEEEVKKAESTLRRHAAHPPAERVEEKENGAAPAPAEPLEVDKAMEALLSLLLTQPELASEVSRRLNPAWARDLGGAEILFRLLDAHAHDGWEGASQFLAGSEGPEHDFLSGLLFSPPPAPEETEPAAYATRLVEQMERRWKQQRKVVLEQEVKSNLFSGEELLRKTAELMQLVKIERAAR